jgi:hypothetical protein
MPTKQEREYYRMGFQDGMFSSGTRKSMPSTKQFIEELKTGPKPKRKLSAWNKFVKANSNKKIYKFANGKLKLKKMGIAFRKTRAGRKK